MCGIYGYWDTTGAPVDLNRVIEATGLLQHRGPDDEGYLLGDTRQSRYLHCGGADTLPDLSAPHIAQLRGQSFDLALGFRRLSILDLSHLGHQPMSSATGRWWIVFNGEIYNYRELRSELQGYGYSFRGGSDTEVILAAFEQWGPDCLRRFNGMWAFALWDTRDRTLFLARDRFGVKPLHYVWDGARLIFASEIKALVGDWGVTFLPDDEVVYHYLLSGRLPSPSAGRTFFRNVHALPPAHFLVLAAGKLTLSRYYSLPAPDPGREEAPGPIVEEYRHLFIDTVQCRLRSDVPVGTCLSGGIDSSAIVCAINRMMKVDGVEAKQVGERQKTFSAVYRSAGRYNETEHIQTVLRATGAEPNFTFPTGEQLCSDLQKLIWHQDEPFGSTSIFAQWCVMAKVRERGVTVLLDGQGADETLGGYQPFHIQLSDLLRRRQYLRAIATSWDAAQVTGISPLSVWARAIVRQVPARYLDRYRQLRDWRRVGSLKSAIRKRTAGNGYPVRMNGGLAEHLKELVTETSLPHLLRYEDRNAMAFGVEGRVPFVDYRLVEYSLTRGLPWSIRGGWTKWLLREAMRDLVPQEIVWRRDKVGFETPEAEWIETCLTRFPDLFHDTAASGSYVEPRSARTLVQEWLTQRGPTAPVWRLLNLELWLQLFSGVPARAAV